MVQYSSCLKALHVQPAARARRRKRKHVPHDQRPQEFVHKRNTRERRRIHDVNHAFQLLRQHVPVVSHDDKTSKISILRHASGYIKRLTSLLRGKQQQTGIGEGLGDVSDAVQWFSDVSGSAGITHVRNIESDQKNCDLTDNWTGDDSNRNPCHFAGGMQTLSGTQPETASSGRCAFSSASLPSLDVWRHLHMLLLLEDVGR
ncbi:hypothetical protein ACOMHN_007821 [Nucella lapillus]